MSIFIALALNYLINDWRPTIRKIACVLIVALILIPLKTNYANNDRRSNFLISDYVENVFQTIDSNSILLTDGDSAIFPLWYSQGLGHRTDLIIIAPKLLRLDWYAIQLNKKSPHIVPIETLNVRGISNNDLIKKRLGIIIKHNLEKFPIYTNYLENIDILEDLTLVPFGILNKIEDKDWNNINLLMDRNKNIWNNYELRGLSKSYKEENLNKIASVYPKSLNNLAIL
jgi:hypothetical protein